MLRLRQLVACLLLALWLPVTLHCALEHTGLLPEAAACADQCAADNCDQLESGLYGKSPALSLRAPVFVSLIVPCLLPALAPPPVLVPRLSPERTDCPPELPRRWQFARRAAPLPGAPSPVA